MINRGTHTAALFAILALLILPAFSQEPPRSPTQLREVRDSYNPTISASNFTYAITNKYLVLKAGTKVLYEKITSKGITHVEMDVLVKTRGVVGVTTLGFTTREWLNKQLIEEATHWVAQDRDENVWNFGETVSHYKDGKLIDHKGSWEAGVDGAKPGILMLSNPKVGDVYRQEYYPGKAEDMRTIVAVGKSLSLAQGPLFKNCVKILDWSRLNRNKAHKFYCVGIGQMVLEEEGAEALILVGLSTEHGPEFRWASEPRASQSKILAAR